MIKLTQSEKQQIVAMFNSGYKISEIAKKLGRCTRTVSMHCPIARGNTKLKSGLYFSAEEIRFILTHKDHMPKYEIAYKLGRSENSIIHKYSALGINPLHFHFAPSYKRALILDAIADGYSMEDVSKMFFGSTKLKRNIEEFLTSGKICKRETDNFLLSII